jgi:hypothetical protein
MTHSKKKHVKFNSWAHKRDKALERFLALHEKDETTGDEWNQALDALALAHCAFTFEWGGGPIKW